MGMRTSRIIGKQRGLDNSIATLGIELQTFEQHRAQLLHDHAGKYALVKGTDVVGIFDSDVAAAEAGYARFGLARFLVKQIVAEDVPLTVMALSLCTG